MTPPPKKKKKKTPPQQQQQQQQQPWARYPSWLQNSHLHIFTVNCRHHKIPWMVPATMAWKSSAKYITDTWEFQYNDKLKKYVLNNKCKHG